MLVGEQGSPDSSLIIKLQRERDSSGKNQFQVEKAPLQHLEKFFFFFISQLAGLTLPQPHPSAVLKDRTKSSRRMACVWESERILMIEGDY